jgi:hypothetical protein
MAVSPYSKGRLMLVSADKPPEIGCSLFESVDGGRHFSNVTDYIAEATAGITEHTPGLLEHCPVVTYVPGAHCYQVCRAYSMRVLHCSK